MSEIRKAVTNVKATGAVLASKTDLPAEPSAADAPATKFSAALLAPDAQHEQMALELLEQLLAADEEVLFLDPGSDAVRVSMQGHSGGTELGALPLQTGRLMIEALRRHAHLQQAAGNPLHGVFFEGLLRVEQGSDEHRLRVSVLPTVHGPAMVVRRIHSYPADDGNLVALGYSPEQAARVEDLLNAGHGIYFLGGADPGWLQHTAVGILGRAAKAGRRPAIITSLPGHDIAGIARFEIGADDRETAAAIARIAEAGYSCIALDRFLHLDIARAAALAALNFKAVVVGNVWCRSAAEALQSFLGLGLPGDLASTLQMASCQIQVPLLCPSCAKWGNVSHEDLGFFKALILEDKSYFVRGGCDQCKSVPTEFTQVFELLELNDAFRECIRTGQHWPHPVTQTAGFKPLLQCVVDLARAGKVSLSEARQYVASQLPYVGMQG